MSEISRIIDGVIKLSLAKTLKEEGYRKSARNFHLVSKTVVRMVNVQASQGNFGNEGKFTLNLGVYLPAIANFLSNGLGQGELPKEYQCTVRERMGELMPRHRDHWWAINPKSDLHAVAEEVNKAWLKCGKPWLDQDWESLSVARDLLDKHHQPLEALAASILLKEPKKAIASVREASRWYRKQGNENAANWIISEAKKFGLEAR